MVIVVIVALVIISEYDHYYYYHPYPALHNTKPKTCIYPEVVQCKTDWFNLLICTVQYDSLFQYHLFLRKI